MDMDSRSVTLAEEKEVGRTATPSPRPSYEKENRTDTDDSPTDKEDGSITNAPAPTSEEEVEGQYPEGFRLAFIVVALLLSIFLVSFLIQYLCE
jgi:MFS transporter, DHA2 family, glioxin efflux transporter